MEALKKLIIVEDSDNDAFQQWSTKNLDLMYFIKFSGIKLSSILGLIPTPDMATNQVGNLSIGPNNTNISQNSRENAVGIDSVIENKGIKESNRNIKIDLEVQSNITTTALVSF